MRFVVLPSTLLLVLTACGGKSLNNGGDASGGTASGGVGTSGSGNRGGAATGGQAPGGSHAGGAAAGAGASGGAGGSPECNAFLDEQGATVAVQLTNETTLPIYLGPQVAGCGLGPLFQVADASGTPLASLGFCTATCTTIMQGVAIACPPIPCIVASVVTLQPGESVVQQWNASYVATASLPPACRPADGTSECSRVVAVEPGAFTFSAQAGTSLDCSQFGGTCSECRPDNNGGCLTFGAIIAGPLLSAETKLMLDASYGVSGTNNDGDAGGGMTRAVEIVFKP